MRYRPTPVVSLLVLAALAGCGGGPKPEEPAPVSGGGSGPSRPTAAPAPAPARDEMADAARRRARLEQKIYFEYDRADLTASAQHVLAGKVDLLRQDAGLRLRIEGHADERGSDEYNLALGNRRAVAAKRYLVQQGISPDRLEVASYGEEQPADRGHHEAAWAANRRGEFRVTAGISSR